jgi:hypothetical protein
LELRFHPGRVFASRRVVALLSSPQRKDLVRRHVSGDWDETHRAKNEEAVRDGGNILSAFFFNDSKGGSVTVWVLTEANRGRTILMCPEESPYRSSDLEEVNDPSFYGWPSTVR